MATDTVKQFFEGLPASVDASRAAGMDNTYLFDIDGAGRWLVRVEGGAVSVSEGTGDADCTIVSSVDNFAKIVSGQSNPTTAYMSGKIKIKGDMGAAMKLQKLF